MSGNLYLGIDTSAYTTSLALVDGSEKLVWENRRQLPVRRGKLGLRQSEAVFAHLRNLPELWGEGVRYLEGVPPAAVAAAVRPRPLPGSYMPVFKVAEMFARFTAQTAGLLFVPCTHQEGHLAAGLWSAGLPPGRYLALHLSGGTTDILAVEDRGDGTMLVETAGGSVDLHVGQFVDRIGVAMGLSFPSGPQLEQMGRQAVFADIELPVAVKGTKISFSGPASHAQRLLDQGCNRCELARAVEKCIADSIAGAVKAVSDLDAFQAILLVGGVAANAFIKERLSGLLKELPPGLPLKSAAPAYSSDNAAGLAVLAARCYRHISS